MFAEIAASRRPIMPSIEIKPLSYLDPRIFAPQVDVSGVVEGNLAATKSVMAGIQSGVSSVAGGIKEAIAMDAAGKQQDFQNWKDVDQSQRGWDQNRIAENRPLSGSGVDPISKSYNNYLNEGYKTNGTDWAPEMDFNQFKTLYSGTGERKQSPSSWYNRNASQGRGLVRLPLE
jgi:hypothetical protein